MYLLESSLIRVVGTLRGIFQLHPAFIVLPKFNNTTITILFYTNSSTSVIIHQTALKYNRDNDDEKKDKFLKRTLFDDQKVISFFLSYSRERKTFGANGYNSLLGLTNDKFNRVEVVDISVEEIFDTVCFVRYCLPIFPFRWHVGF